MSEKIISLQRLKNFIPCKLTQQREIKGLNKVELAELLQVTPQAISQFELGHTKPSFKMVKKMSEVLNITPRFFYIKPIGTREKINMFFCADIKH